MQDANLNSGTPFFKIRIFKYTKSKLLSLPESLIAYSFVNIVILKMELMHLPDSSVTLNFMNIYEPKV